MTFYEAALLILEKEGKPLHFKDITERAVSDKLLSHVGKDPEAVMYSRLAAMARRKGDRKVIATQVGTFGLLDWGLAEDLAALDAKVLPEPDETEPPLRPRERHPLPLSQVKAARAERAAAERTEKDRSERGDRKRRDDDKAARKGNRLPELVFELLSQASGPMAALDVAAGSWRIADDPQPVPDASDGGSIWPATGDRLVKALDVPVWNLLNSSPYWLYRRAGETCPWYPSMRLFRQEREGDWDDVFAKLPCSSVHSVC